MGLDVVEIVMRTEEVFAITISDEDAEQAVTVGKLYELVCTRLGLPSSPTRPTGAAIPAARHTGPLRITPEPDPLPNPAADDPHEKVWATLVALIVDQLQVDESEVVYDAHWGNDLPAD